MTDPREVMGQADRLRDRAKALDHMMLRMRLGSRAYTKPGRTIFFKRERYDTDEMQLTKQEDQIFYEWCRDKKGEYEREAARLDSTLRVVAPKPTADAVQIADEYERRIRSGGDERSA